VDGENVRSRRELIDVRCVLDAEVRRLRRVERPTPGDDVEPKRLRASGHLAPDGAHPGDAERLPVHALGLPVLAALPAPGPERGDGIGDPPVQRYDHRHDELGDRAGVPARAVRDVDALLARGSDVDRLELRARAHDEVELPGFLDRLRGHRRRPDDQDAHAR
jgi:hypothetical protein